MSLRVVFADVNPLAMEVSGGATLPRLRDTGGGPIGTSSVFREPYGAEWVAATAEAWAGVEAEVLMQGTASPEEYALRIARRHPDVVALGMHASCVAPEGFRILPHLRQLLPDVPVITGGYHPSGDPGGVIDAGFDAVVVNAAEPAFAEICASMVEGRPWDDVHGVVAKGSTGTRRLSRFADIPFSEYPWPHRCAEAIRMSRCAPLAYPPPDEQSGAAQISYSRGCPYACSYCQSDQVFGRRVPFRDPRDVVEEIRHVKETYGADFFFFTDLTFNLNHKRVYALCEEMVQAKLDIHWFAYGTVDGLDQDLLDAMRAAGCTRLGMGIESVVEETLDRAKSALKYRKLEQIQQSLERVDRAGILIRGYLMAGWPWEDEEYYRLTGDALKVLPIDQVRIAFAVPFAGTALAGEHPVITRDLSRYTTNEPVFRNPNLSPEEQTRLVSGLVRTYQNSASYRDHVRSKTTRFPELRRSYRYFTRYLAERGDLDDPTLYDFLQDRNLDGFDGTRIAAATGAV